MKICDSFCILKTRDTKVNKQWGEPMKLRDLSIRKKLILSNMMMIAIPVLIVITIMGSIILSFFVLAGTGSRAGLLTNTNGVISNYQLQLVFDSMGKEVLHNNRLTDNRDFLDSCAELEKAGAKVSVYDDSNTYYPTEGANVNELHAAARQIAGPIGSETLFYRSENGLVYQTSVKNKDGKPLVMLVTSEKLNYRGGEQNFLNTAERYVKLGVFAVGSMAIIIIILTGIILSGILSKRMITPLDKLRQAAKKIENGNLDDKIDYIAQDELGQVCKDFDSMRLRLKESVQLQKKYEDDRKELIAGISHDLSTPLTTIKGYTSGLIEGIANTPERQEHYLRTIYDTACNMDKLVDSLFLFSKLDLGRIQFNMEAVDLVSYFEDYCSEMQSQLNERNIHLNFVNHCTGKAEVNIDRLQFNRVLSNLVGNSVKYKKDGLGKIEITLEDKEKEICIQFADNGSGVSDSEAEKIFDSFYRTDPARSNVAKGSGLGLAITKQIVEHMNGCIFAKGHLNDGLTINIILPKSDKESSK